MTHPDFGDRDPAVFPETEADSLFFLPVSAILVGCLTLLTCVPSWAQSAASLPQTPNAATQPTADLANAYTLGRGDRVRLDIFNVPEYGGEYLVLADGTLSLPLVGPISVQGMTLKQASSVVAAKYGQSILNRPIVTLSLVNVRPIKIAIAGEVNRPGAYNFSSTDLEKQGGVPTVTSAIQIAGGITQSADIRNIQIRRALPVGETADQLINVNLWQLLQTADLKQDLPLRDGDTIVVPVAPPLSPAEATKLAAASFSPNTIRVNVVGEAVRPGTVEVPPNTPLNQALLAAGGFNNRAKKDAVELVRLNPNGTVTRQSIAINLAQGLDEKHNPALRNSDTIVVRRSSLAGVSDALGTILSPITGFFSVFKLLGL